MSIIDDRAVSRSYPTPDGQVEVICDDDLDRAWIDGATDPDGLSVEQLAATIGAAERALVHLLGVSRSRERLARHVETRARAVADRHGRAAIRENLRYADMERLDNLTVDVWRRAAELLDLVDGYDTRRVADAFGTDRALVDLLVEVDDGRVQQYAGAGDGPVLLVDRTRLTAVQAQWLADLRHDGLVEPHLLVTTSLGWAVRRALVAAGAGVAA